MATPKKSPAAHLAKHKWKPGETGNPNGRPAITAEQRAIRSLTLEKYREVIEIVLTGTIEDLKDLADDPKTPVFQVYVARAIMSGLKSGDLQILEQLASRLVGKIPDQINIKAETNANVNSRVTVATEAVRAAMLKLKGEV